MLKVLGFLSVLVLFCAMTAPTASADSITYTYTGNPFTSFFPPLPSGVSAITGSFTLSNPLGANFSGNVTPLSYSFSDGATTLTQANSVAGFLVFTDPTGAINSWCVEIYNPDPNSPTVFALITCATASEDASINWLTGGQAFNNFSPGTWSAASTTVVPEPSSLILLGSGLLGVLGAARRKLSFRAK